MAQAKAQISRSTGQDDVPSGQQIVLGAVTRAAFAPVPDLAALEQIGGPEFDVALELPTRAVWASRPSPDLGDA